MPLDASLPYATDLLSVLRETTASSHERLDAAFGELALSQRDGIARFLRAHAIGMSALSPTFRHFVEDGLGLPCPDYCAMLATDLDALGEPWPTDADAPLAASQPGMAAGISYVVAGSRLGLTVIRKRGYWGGADGFRSAYMEDGTSPTVWKTLVPYLRARGSDSAENDGARRAALESFQIFARAFAASASSVTLRQVGHG